MADMLNDGQIKVTFVPAIANTAAPTTAELAAGTALECLITADGLEIKTDEGVIEIPKLCETAMSQAPGRTTHGVTLTMVRQTVPGADLGWTVLLRGTVGFLVIRLGLTYTTAYATAQKVIVYPGKVGERRLQKPEMNGATKFMSQWYVSAQPNLDAAIA